MIVLIVVVSWLAIIIIFSITSAYVRKVITWDRIGCNVKKKRKNRIQRSNDWLTGHHHHHLIQLLITSYSDYTHTEPIFIHQNQNSFIHSPIIPTINRLSFENIKPIFFFLPGHVCDWINEYPFHPENDEKTINLSKGISI